MGDIHNWYRIIALVVILHIVLFFAEFCEYKRSNFTLSDFILNGMGNMTYFVLAIDSFIIFGAIIVWAISPLVS